jgi:hypothetical protein
MDHYTIERFRLAARVAATVSWPYFLALGVSLAGFAVITFPYWGQQ